MSILKSLTKGKARITIEQYDLADGVKHYTLGVYRENSLVKHIDVGEDLEEAEKFMRDALKVMSKD